MTLDPHLQDLLDQQRFIRTLARRLVRDASTADDLTQDTNIAALERPPRSRAAMGSWLGTVVRNLARNMARGEGRRSERERTVARHEAQPSHEAIAERLEVARRVIEVVQGLGEPYRETIYLRFYEGLGVGAIARRQGISIDTVKTRLRRALVRLREELDRRGDRSTWLPALAPLAVGRLETTILGGIAAAANTAGGLVLMKKLVWVALGALILVGGWRLWERRAVAPPTSDGAVANAAPIEAPAPVRDETHDAEAPTDTREARVPAALAPGEHPGGSAPGALEIQVLWEEDLTPAVNVELLAYPSSVVNGQDVLRAATDDAGIARFDQLRAGPIRVDSFRGGGEECCVLVESGKTKELEFVMPSGVDVEGTVVDQDGRPVAGADVWLSRKRVGWLAARLVTRTDAAGRFALRDLAAASALSARAVGHASSLREDLALRKPEPGEPVRVELRLRGPGGALEGQVQDPEREPVPGALVAVGSPFRHAQREDGRWSPLAPPALVTTDGEGRFRADGIDPADLVELQVLARGFPPAGAWVEVRAGETASVTVRLAPGVTVEGTARDAGGNPVEEVWLTLDQVDGRSAGAGYAYFSSPYAMTRAGGAYRFDALPRGELTLTARPLSDDRLSPATTTIRGEPGRTYRWDPILGATRTISGRLVDPHGAPLADWRVWARPTTQSDLAGGNGRGTDAEGRFSLHVQEPGTYVLVADLPERPDIAPVEREVEAGTSGLVVVASTVGEPTAAVVGHFEDAGERVSAQDRLQAVLMETLLSPAATAEVEDGAFRLGPVSPGSYRVEVRAGGRVVLSTRAFELEAGEEHDLGTLATETPGSVRVRFTAEEGLDPRSVQLLAVDWERQYQHLLVLDGESFVGTGLPPASYGLTVFGEQAATLYAPFEVRAREETELTVHLRPGAMRVFDLRVPAGSGAPERVTIQVVDESAATIYRYAGAPLGWSGDSLPFALALPLGSFALSVETDSGLAAVYRLAVRDLEAELDPIAIELR